MHSGLSLNELAAGGAIAPDLHSHEEGVYVLAGQAAVTVEGRAISLGPGDFALFKVGVTHAWENRGAAPVCWRQMAAPQPKPAGRGHDTFFPSLQPPASDLQPPAPTGHFDVAQIPPEAERPAASPRACS